MAERKTFDAIVVGGGSVGVPSAYYLAERGLKTLVIDRRPAVGQGENKAAIGGVRATHSDARRSSSACGPRGGAALKEQHGDEIGWKPGGYCFPVYGEELEGKLRGLFPIQRRYGLQNDWSTPTPSTSSCPGSTARGCGAAPTRRATGRSPRCCYRWC